MRFTQAIAYERFGPPADVLKLVGVPRIPLDKGEVYVRMIAAPIHPSDFGMINGSYGRLPQLPAIAGREGVGEVIEIGPGVKGVKIGQRVAFAPDSTGTWQELIRLSSSDLVKVPESLHAFQSAMALINPPTAWCLLNNFVDLKEGDWIIQNGAHSAVGQLVIQLAKLRGIKTLNVVRDLKQAAFLTQLGADAVVAEGSAYWKDLPALTHAAPIRLALNSIGGSSAITLMRTLAMSGVMVTFGAASSELVKFPTKPFIFNDIRLFGFWWDRYKRTLPSEKLLALYQELLDLMDKDLLKSPIDKVYPLDVVDAAILHAEQPGRHGKILLVPSISA